MHVHTCLFPREEEQSKFPVANNCRSHFDTVTLNGFELFNVRAQREPKAIRWSNQLKRATRALL